MITPASTALSLLKTGALSLSKKGTIQDNSLATLLSKLDPEKADALRKKHQEAQNILGQLKGSQSDVARNRKADAAEKVQQIKQKLQALRLMASINPKAAARQAAQLSRELAQAAKDYVQAGGGATTSISTGMTALPAQAPGAAAAGTPADVPSSTPAEGGGATAVAAEAKAIENEVAGDAVAERKEEAGADAQGVPPSVKEGVEAQIRELSEKSSHDRADAEFKKQVEDVKGALKRIIELAKKKLESKEDPSATQDIKEAESAFRDIDRSLDEISNGGTGGVLTSLNLLV